MGGVLTARCESPQVASGPLGHQGRRMRASQLPHRVTLVTHLPSTLLQLLGDASLWSEARCPTRASNGQKVSAFTPQSHKGGLPPTPSELTTVSGVHGANRVGHWEGKMLSMGGPDLVRGPARSMPLTADGNDLPVRSVQSDGPCRADRLDRRFVLQLAPALYGAN
jgi:hypothetical protein